jgi:gas vesicle protein
VRDRSAILLGAIAGAVAGGAAGWLWLTEDGRRLRTQLEPRLQDLAGHAAAVSAAARRVQAAARDGAQTAREVASRATQR